MPVEENLIQGQQLLETAVGWLIQKGILLVVVLALAFVAVRVSRRLIGRLERRLQLEDTQAGRNQQRSRTLATVSRGVVSVVVWTLALLVVLRSVVPDLGPVFAGVGIAGIAVGFGAQSLVRDFLTGFFVLLEDQYRVGDIIEIDGVGGVVEHFSLRRTALRSLDGSLHHIANGDIKLVSNRSSGWSKAILDVGVSYTEDLTKVGEVLRRAGSDLMVDPEIGRYLIEAPEILGVESFAESSVTVRIAAKTIPGKQWTVSRAYRQGIKEAFDREGISIPFPHRVMIHQSVGG